MFKRLVRGSLLISLLFIVSITLTGCDKVNIDQIFSGIKNFIGEFADGVSKVITQGVEFVKKVINTVKEAVKPVIEGAKELAGKMKDGVNQIKDSIKGSGNKEAETTDGSEKATKDALGNDNDNKASSAVVSSRDEEVPTKTSIVGGKTDNSKSSDEKAKAVSETKTEAQIRKEAEKAKNVVEGIEKEIDNIKDLTDKQKSIVFKWGV